MRYRERERSGFSVDPVSFPWIRSFSVGFLNVCLYVFMYVEKEEETEREGDTGRQRGRVGEREGEWERERQRERERERGREGEGGRERERACVCDIITPCTITNWEPILSSHNKISVKPCSLA